MRIFCIMKKPEFRDRSIYNRLNECRYIYLENMEEEDINRRVVCVSLNENNITKVLNNYSIDEIELDKEKLSTLNVKELGEIKINTSKIPVVDQDNKSIDYYYVVGDKVYNSNFTGCRLRYTMEDKKEHINKYADSVKCEVDSKEEKKITYYKSVYNGLVKIEEKILLEEQNILLQVKRKEEFKALGLEAIHRYMENEAPQKLGFVREKIGESYEFRADSIASKEIVIRRIKVELYDSEISSMKLRNGIYASRLNTMISNMIEFCAENEIEFSLDRIEEAYEEIQSPTEYGLSIEEKGEEEKKEGLEEKEEEKEEIGELTNVKYDYLEEEFGEPVELTGTMIDTDYIDSLLETTEKLEASEGSEDSEASCLDKEHEELKLTLENASDELKKLYEGTDLDIDKALEELNGNMIGEADCPVCKGTGRALTSFGIPIVCSCVEKKRVRLSLIAKKAAEFVVDNIKKDDLEECVEKGFIPESRKNDVWSISQTKEAIFKFAKDNDLIIDQQHMVLLLATFNQCLQASYGIKDIGRSFIISSPNRTGKTTLANTCIKLLYSKGKKVAPYVMLKDLAVARDKYNKSLTYGKDYEKDIKHKWDEYVNAEIAFVGLSDIGDAQLELSVLKSLVTSRGNKCLATVVLTDRSLKSYETSSNLKINMVSGLITSTYEDSRLDYLWFVALRNTVRKDNPKTRHSLRLEDGKDI